MGSAGILPRTSPFKYDHVTRSCSQKWTCNGFVPSPISLCHLGLEREWANAAERGMAACATALEPHGKTANVCFSWESLVAEEGLEPPTRGL